MDVYQRRRCAIAYTKIIPVRHHLQRCLDYTSNPNKTEIFTESDLKRLLSYTQNQDKTEHQLYVSGFQCDPDTACQSMEETKRVWFMPTDKGILAYHIIQSFAPGELRRSRCIKSAASLPAAFWQTDLNALSVPIWTRDICIIMWL